MEPRRMIVIGAGGIGGWLLRGLAPMLEFRAPGSILVVVDGDNFEQKNRERQDFERMGNKAEVRVAELQAMYPETFLVADTRWVVEKANDQRSAEDGGRQVSAVELLAEGDVVFAVVDNHSARKVLFDAARQFDDIDIFTGGNDDALYGSVYHYQRRGGIDVTDHPAEWHPELISPPDRNPGEMSCSERAELEGGTQLLATNMSVAAWLLAKVHRHIFEEIDPRSANEGQFDWAVGKAESFSRIPDPVPATQEG